MLWEMEVQTHPLENKVIGLQGFVVLELKPSIMDSRLVQHFVCLQFISLVAIGWFSFSPKEIKEAKNREEGMMLLNCTKQ